MNGHDETPENGFNGNSSSPNPNAAAEQPALASPAAPLTQKRYIKGYENRNAARSYSATTLPPQPTINYGENVGNIVINNVPAKKRNKATKFVVFGAIITIVVAVAAIFMVNYFSRPSLAEVKNTYNEYLDYLKNGPRSGDNNSQPNISENNWFFFTLFQEDENYYGKIAYDDDEIAENDDDMAEGEDDETNDENSDGEVTSAEYILELKKKFIEFKNKLNIARLGSAGKTNIKALADEYSTELELLIMYEDSETLSDELLQKFVENGVSGAKEFLDKAFAVELGNEDYRKLNDLLKQYAEKQLSNIEIFNANGCIENNRLDDFCDISIDNEKMNQNFTAQNQLFSEADALYPNLKKSFVASTKEIDNLLGDNNE